MRGSCTIHAVRAGYIQEVAEGFLKPKRQLGMREDEAEFRKRR